MPRAGSIRSCALWRITSLSKRSEKFSHLCTNVQPIAEMCRDVPAFTLPFTLVATSRPLAPLKSTGFFARGFGRGVSGRLPFYNFRNGTTSRCCVTEEQKAFIFQRSPYHHYRLRRYGDQATDEGTSLSSAREDVIPKSQDSKEFAEEGLEDLPRTENLSVDPVVSDQMPAESGVSPIFAKEERDHVNGVVSPQGSDSKRKTRRTGRKTTVASSENEANTEKEQERRFTSHDDLLKAFYAITGDPLETDGGRIVVHRGNPKARIMIIGEAPGEQEDVQGKPFVGRAGQLLDKIFGYGGFDTEKQVYITNIAKRRPANNRTPTLEEVQYYLPYLREEIRLVDPVIIVLAGRVASQALLGADIRITKIRGQWFPQGKNGENGPLIMPVFHPAYLLRNPVAKYDMVTDIEQIREKYMELVPEDALKPLKNQ